ncbi:hypothetical protein HN807_02215 [Candidatus Bathyarchaeota archaeon]|jgi:hypothetical protein|nr:hypothetical protein [Candidatus Bathyarchaeota archaeon]MBT4319477.1 hypothetical protein [Candidatus Bathyarchaeota archaeon]MBT4423220.1 hypothetical protein [Candidatus Bathyarchaeota archaeon]MBT5643401.1 hypothetical protein [Candidatus Bathyarchaeota archaeon]MBT6604004.1 hypothetical protein [Candidatus Bathyarchaeota archaeon]
MAQEYVVIHETAPEKLEFHESLHRCVTCSKVVPKTMLCLYCGTPILYKTPGQE